MSRRNLPEIFAQLFFTMVLFAVRGAPAQTLEVHEVTATDTQTTSGLQTYWADHSYDRWYNPHGKLRITVVDTTQRSPLAKVYLLFVARKKTAAELFIYNYAILTANFFGEPQLLGELPTPALGPEEKDPKGADVAGWIAIGRSGPSRFGIAASDQALLDIAKSGGTLGSLISTAEDSSKLAVLTKGESASAIARPPTTPAAPPLPETVTLVEPVSIRIPYGTTTLQPGTRLRCIARDGANVRVTTWMQIS